MILIIADKYTEPRVTLSLFSEGDGVIVRCGLSAERAVGRTWCFAKGLLVVGLRRRNA